MAANKKTNALEFCRNYLRRSPKASFTQIRDAAKKKRITLYPISYGRAQSLEGLLKSKPKKAAAKQRGRPKGSKNKPKKAAAKQRGRPKGSKNKPKGGMDLSGLDGLVTSLKSLQKERDDALSLLAKIRDLVG